MMDLKPRYSKEKPIQDLKKAQKEEEAMEKRLEDAKSRIPPAPQGEIQRLQEELDDQREYIGQIQKAIDTDAERRSEEGKKLHDEKAAAFKSVSDEVNRLSEQTEKLPQIQLSYQRLLGEIDDLVNQLFIASDASNSFRLRMSVAFSILVGLVIVGFFIVAYTNDEVKKSIFSNESGIQFITLFCLVVAIILFGIINILEGKELSALLGGLSGYILGRGTPTNSKTTP
jgi:hypothetical protein